MKYLFVKVKKLAELKWQCKVLLLLLLLLNKSILLWKRLLYWKLHLKGFLCVTHKRKQSIAYKHRTAQFCGLHDSFTVSQVITVPDTEKTGKHHGTG